MKIFHRIKKYEKGFTLMEVMVSVTIFTVIVTIGMGALITIFKTLQKTRADRQTIDSISFVLDTMTRRIRTGKDYTYTDIGGIKFTDQDGVSVSFYNDQDGDGNSRIYMIDGAFGSETEAVDITPENFKVEAFTLSIIETNPADTIQPMVTINLKGAVKNGQQESKLAVQTIVSQRLLDFPQGSPLSDDGSGNGIQKTGGGSFSSSSTFTGPRSEPGGFGDMIIPSSPIPEPTTQTGTLKALSQPR